LLLNFEIDIEIEVDIEIDIEVALGMVAKSPQPDQREVRGLVAYSPTETTQFREVRTNCGEGTPIKIRRI
jgi:hypothetical protein